MRVKAAQFQDYTPVCVCDTGYGISERDFATIFLPYPHSSSLDSKQGLGLGLLTARRCIELHGVRIEVQSTLGQGSTFTLLTPSSQTQWAFEPNL
ncbi:sensor histidine kinase [Pelagicoccus sp. SDUM812002]|uniref:sensor histidine kinase n=1 Tax=Pelagicoccus sp. SDUM812002 TaxID=3041266 RepID=UPI0034E1C379